MKTEFHINGIWFYVTWGKDGKQGIDQRGQKWYDVNNPHTETKITEIICQSSAEGIKMAATKMSRI
jgi:hypothetical protein